MKKYILIFTLPLLMLLLGAFSPKPTNAADFHFKSYTLKQDEIIKDDVYIFGDNAQIDGIVEGDLFVVSQDLKLNGTVTGDVYIASMNSEIKGNIYGNFISVSSDQIFDGISKGNIFTLSNNLIYDGQTEKDLFVMASKNSISGTVGDDLRIVAPKAAINTIVKGDLIVLAESYQVLKEKVSGNIYDSSTLKGIAKEQGVDLDKEVKINTPEWRVTTFQRVTDVLIGFFGLSIVGYLMIMLTPLKTLKIKEKITGSSTEFLKSLGIGFVILFFIPIPLILLAISMIGTPLSFLIFGILLFLTVFGRLWVEVAFGQEILELFKVKGYRPFKSLLIGRGISVLIELIPFFGFMYSIVLMCTGTGAAIRMKMDAWKEAKAVEKELN